MGWKVKLIALLALSFGLIAALSSGTRAQDAPAAKAEQKSYRLKALLEEFSAKTGKVVVVEEVLIAQIRDLVTISPEGNELDVETRLRESLAQQRLALFLDGDAYRVVTVAQATSRAPVVELADLGKYHRLEWVSCVVQLSTIDANVARTSIAPFMSREGVVAPTQFGNCMIVVESAHQVKRIADILKSFDEKAARARTVHSVTLPEGLNRDEVTKAVKEVAKVDGHTTLDGKRFLFAADPDHAEEIRKRVMSVAQKLKGE